jgi:hypothetical protein
MPHLACCCPACHEAGQCLDRQGDDQRWKHETIKSRHIACDEQFRHHCAYERDPRNCATAECPKEASTTGAGNEKAGQSWQRDP